MSQLVRESREKKRQQGLRGAFKGSVAVAGVVAGVFFVWLAFAVTASIDGSSEPLISLFLRVLSFVFGGAIATACVSFAYMKS